MRGSLSRAGVRAIVRDFFAEPFSEGELLALLAGTPPRAILATRSPSARRLAPDPGALTDGELLRLMLREPRLIRRPLVVVDGRLLVAPSTEALARELAR